MRIKTTVNSIPSCERAQATVQLQTQLGPAAASIPQDEPSLLVLASAIDVNGMHFGLHEDSQFVVRWNNTSVSMNAHRQRAGLYVATIEKEDRQELGVYALEVELSNGLNESIGKTVQSCLLKTTTVTVTEAQVWTFDECYDHACSCCNMIKESKASEIDDNFCEFDDVCEGNIGAAITPKLRSSRSPVSELFEDFGRLLFFFLFL